MRGETPRLGELQRAFHALVLRRAGAPAPETLVAGDARLDAAGRVAIYAEMYRARLHDAIAGDHPKLHAVLGDAGLAELLDAYLEECPPRNPSLRWAGDRLAAFLAERAPWCAHPWLAELARLEWARVDAFDAADAAPLAAGDLAGRTPEAFAALSLRLVPSARLVVVQHEVDAVWRALERDEEPPIPPAPAPRTILVWRRGLGVLHRALDSDEAAPVRAIAAGATFAEVCELVARGRPVDEAAPDALALLVRWMEAEVLARPEELEAPGGEGGGAEGGRPEPRSSSG